MKLTKLENIDYTEVSHNASIKKKVLVKNGLIPHLTNFSIATFPPGEVANEHSHEDMTEVFFIQSGLAEMYIEGEVIELTEGSCITVEPNEKHELRNVGLNDLVVMYFGIES